MNLKHLVLLRIIYNSKEFIPTQIIIKTFRSKFPDQKLLENTIYKSISLLNNENYIERRIESKIPPKSSYKITEKGKNLLEMFVPQNQEKSPSDQCKNPRYLEDEDIMELEQLLYNLLISELYDYEASKKQEEKIRKIVGNIMKMIKNII